MSDFENVGADEFTLIGAGGQGQIQFIRSDAPDAVAERILAIARRINTDYLHLGREIYKVFHRRMYLDYGYSTFDECMSDKFGISRERADRVRRVWTKFVKELGIKLEDLDGIGFSRAYALLSVINDDNARQLLDRAKTVRTTKEFTEHVDVLKGKPKAIQRVKDSAQFVEEKVTEHKSATASGRLPAQTVEPIVETKEDERPTKVTFNLYPSQREIIEAAIQEVQRNKTGGGFMAPNEALAHVALGFLSDQLVKDERPNAQVRFYLSWFERVYGGKFVWITSDEAACVLSRAIEENPALFPQQGKTTTEVKEIDDEHPDDDDDSDE